MNSSVDEWSIGPYDKNPIWFTYGLINITGGFLNLLLIISILSTNRRKNTGDICIIGLSSGCCLMSFPCGMQ